MYVLKTFASTCTLARFNPWHIALEKLTPPFFAIRIVHINFTCTVYLNEHVARTPPNSLPSCNICAPLLKHLMAL